MPTAARRRSLPAVALLAAGFVALAAPATRADVVTTKDGVVLEGTVVRAADGSVTVRTAEGDVLLAASAVASVDTGEGPRAAIEREGAHLTADDAVGRFRLALRAEAKGLPDVARRLYAAVVALEPENAAARRALGQEKVEGAWMAAEEARRRHGLVLYAGAWVLPQEAEAAAKAQPPSLAKDATLVSVMRSAATGEPALALAAKRRLLDAAATARTEAATALLLDADPRVRTWACSELAVLGDETALRPLILSAVRDADKGVRHAAVLAVAAFGNDDAAVPFVRALDSIHPGMVASAAQALADFGDRRAVVYIVKHLISHGSSARSVVESLSKVSYIRDYDVEIAQNANIANPIIGRVVEGSVLDVKVLDASIEKTVVETVLIDAVNALAGTSFRDVPAVAAWWGEKGSSFPEFPRESESRRHRGSTPASATGH